MATSVNIIANYLSNAGIRHAFGIPGGEVLAIIEALGNAGIEFTLVKHENAGGFMAEGSHHAMGAPGLLIATLGPGVANAVNVIANAQQDRVPLIFLTGCVDDDEAMRYTHQIFDHGAVLQPVTKASFRLADGAVEETIDKALAIAMDYPPGPVHIDIPIRIATREQAERRVQKRCHPSFGIPDQKALDYILDSINRAHRPVAIAGMGVLQHGAEKEIRSFIEDATIPLITTYKAKGLIDENHELSLGGTGLSPKSESILLPLVKQADLVLLLGYDPIEMRPGWRDVWSEDTTVIELGTDVNTHYMHQASAHYYCELKPILALLRQGLSCLAHWQNGALDATRSAMQQAFLASTDWGPATIIETIMKNLPENSVATVDTGAHRILLSQMWRCRQPHTLLQSTGLCTMGVAVPMALGYKMAKPEVPVVAFTGDAGMEMVLGDLATVRDQKLPITIIVFVDESLALIELKQRAMSYANSAVDFALTDFTAIGRAYGFRSEWVDSPEQLADELADAQKSDQTTVLACRFPRQAYDGSF